MLATRFRFSSQSSPTLLFFGAHSDDIEIGCGGSILRLLDEIPKANVYWVVFGCHGVRRQEALESATAFLAKAGETRIVLKDFKDGHFPYYGQEIKAVFEEIKGLINPDLIFTHFRQDLHQDHRIISDMTWNTFRNHMILEYEIIKYDGDLGSPNFFIQLDESYVNRKISLIIDGFKSQAEKHWFTPDTFRSLLRLRGVESNSEGRFAEAYFAEKPLFKSA